MLPAGGERIIKMKQHNYYQGLESLFKEFEVPIGLLDRMQTFALQCANKVESGEKIHHYYYEDGIIDIAHKPNLAHDFFSELLLELIQASTPSLHSKKLACLFKTIYYPCGPRYKADPRTIKIIEEALNS